ncbi:hypothetical protein VE01_03073 [Pseudogymnoascus verrucosus]|uniref:Cytokinesis inhibitor byr4 n=1 Tax=Pseudogymnoascus verrucosus TaxID=342668 RepID=A0A1B8GR63_9PEZI|nr:uncharacterized protein VE01_03073 [Pseudogymnoascus verrucosus]OBT98326.1 hypothetical protein VE01_03073 [Pseudogymnoascus verrucosus]
MLQLKPRQVVEEAVENWDDDDLDIGGDDFTFPSRTVSIATSAGLSHHRESISSRLSIRSDFDSNFGDEERQVQVPGDDERSRHDAIAAATRAGIPLPQNVPASALMGGTIKRLGGKKVKKVIQQDDWDDDLELPSIGGKGFQIKKHDPSEFPDALRQVSGQSGSATNEFSSPEFSKFDEFDKYATIRPKTNSGHLNLDQFRDGDDDDDFFGGGGGTIKVTKKRLVKPVTVVVPPTPVKPGSKEDDDFESDFQLPSDGKPLRLSIGKDIPKTPASSQDEFDEWGEGSLGTRFGGTRRSDGRSNRSSSASALSPSVSSSITIESEDEGLDGLVLPTGPFNFEDILKKRQETQSPEHQEAQTPAAKPESTRPAAARLSSKDDFLFGLEIGDGDVFNSGRLTHNRNVKVKTSRPMSPQRPKTAVSLKFTDKPSPPVGSSSRLPRPLGHERHASNLDPVSESGGPMSAQVKRTHSRLGHSSQSSVSSIPTPATPTSVQSLPPLTPRRRDLTQKPSLNALRNEPTTTNAQLLKLKRSMPIIRHTNSPAKPAIHRYDRPPSRTDSNSRPNSIIRPKTPVDRDRSGADSSMSHARRNPVPFLPAGNSTAQSHHVTIKTSRHFRQNDSTSSITSDYRSSSRAMSRTTVRSPSPNRARLRNPEALAREAASKRQVTKPSKQRHFGDGRELDGFDDLPTSQTIEQKYIKQPIGRGPPKALMRNKVYQNTIPDRSVSTTPLPGPYSPARYENNRYENLPRYTRDTNASRMAREQVLSQRAPSSQGGPLSTLTNQWKAQIAAKSNLQATRPPQSLRTKKSKPVQQRPHLIKPLSDTSKTTKSVKGMTYNPTTYLWEGNENDLSPFDAPIDSPTPSTIPPHLFREKESSTPRPALITNINASQGVQVVGGMVFDPQRMCWLKVPHQKRGKSLSRNASEGGDTMDGFDALDDEEEDVFKDVPDLEDKPSASSPSRDAHESGAGGRSRKSGGTDGGGLKDDWLVGEEFDVGPEFVRRQREEEERWKRKVEKWIGKDREVVDRESNWRWRIRDVVNQL